MTSPIWISPFEMGRIIGQAMGSIFLTEQLEAFIEERVGPCAMAVVRDGIKHEIPEDEDDANTGVRR